MTTRRPMVKGFVSSAYRGKKAVDRTGEEFGDGWRVVRQLPSTDKSRFEVRHRCGAPRIMTGPAITLADKPRHHGGRPVRCESCQAPAGATDSHLSPPKLDRNNLGVGELASAPEVASAVAGGNNCDGRALRGEENP